MSQAVLATVDDVSNLPVTSGSSTLGMLQAVLATVDASDSNHVIGKYNQTLRDKYVLYKYMILRKK